MTPKTQPLPHISDPRGALLKAWPGPVRGEVYAVELRPGSSRGHHLHRHGGEWFIPVTGQVVLVVEDPATGQRAELDLDGIRARVEPGQAHALFVRGPDPAWVIAIADLAFPDDQTVPHPVAPPADLAPP